MNLKPCNSDQLNVLGLNVRRSEPAVRREADAADRLVEVEVMKDGSSDEADQQGGAVCQTSNNLNNCFSPTKQGILKN